MLGSQSEGEATEEEAADPEVRQLLALAKPIQGGEAPAPKQRLRTGVVPRAVIVAEQFLTSRARRSTNSSSRHISPQTRASSIVPSGAWRTSDIPLLPRLDEVRERDADYAEVLRAIAETNADQLKAAAVRLRPLVGRSRLAVLQLSETYVRQGKPEDAAELLRTGGQRFSDVCLLLESARPLLKLERTAEAEQSVILALSLAPAPSPLRGEARWIEVEIAAKGGDPAAVEAAASTAISEGEDDPSIRWVRAEVLLTFIALTTLGARFVRPLRSRLTPRAVRLFRQLLMRREPSRLELMAQV